MEEIPCQSQGMIPPCYCQTAARRQEGRECDQPNCNYSVVSKKISLSLPMWYFSFCNENQWKKNIQSHSKSFEKPEGRELFTCFKQQFVDLFHSQEKKEFHGQLSLFPEDFIYTSSVSRILSCTPNTNTALKIVSKLFSYFKFVAHDPSLTFLISLQRF